MKRSLILLPLILLAAGAGVVLVAEFNHRRLTIRAAQHMADLVDRAVHARGAQP